MAARSFCVNPPGDSREVQIVTASLTSKTAIGLVNPHHSRPEIWHLRRQGQHPLLLKTMAGSKDQQWRGDPPNSPDNRFRTPKTGGIV